MKKETRPVQTKDLISDLEFATQLPALYTHSFAVVSAQLSLAT